MKWKLLKLQKAQEEADKVNNAGNTGNNSSSGSAMVDQNALNNVLKNHTAEDVAMLAQLLNVKPATSHMRANVL